MYICIVKQNKKTMGTLAITFKSAKADIQDCWANPIHPSDRITRNWIYAVDPETMTFAKAVFAIMPGTYSLYTSFVEILISGSLDSLLLKAKKISR